MFDTESNDEFIGKNFGRGGRLVVKAMHKKGGIGTVYEAWDLERERKVAMKFLRPEFSSSDEVMARFKREGRRFASLSHKNIVKVYGLGREHGQLYIASEFIEGRNLAEILTEDGHFEADEALRVCLDVAAALGAAHEKNIVHRDLKPENIMIREHDKCVLVLDFGIAKSLDSSTMVTKKGAYVGTPGYSAPEQIRGRKIDHRTDIFPLGAILYEMLTGKLAFDGRHTTQVLGVTLKERPIPVTRFNSEVVTPVANLIDKMIQKRPERRHQNMAELMDEIAEIRRSLDEGYDLSETSTIVVSLKRLLER